MPAGAEAPPLAAALDAVSTGDWDGAYDHSRAAFRAADAPRDRYHAARIAALSALADDRPIATRYWLRRAGDVAPDAVTRNRIEQHYRALQLATPWAVELDFGVRNSSNVNGGSNEALSFVEGLPVGTLSEDAQALEGQIFTTGIDLSWRLGPPGARTEPRVRLEVEDQRVRLEDAPDGVSGSDFSRTDVALGFGHVWRNPEAGWLSDADVFTTASWYGGESYYTGLGVAAGHARQIAPRLTLSGRAAFERRDYAGGGSGDELTFGVSLGLRLPWEDRMTVSVARVDEAAVIDTLDNVSTSLQVSYERAEPIGPVSIGLRAGIGQTDYENYRLLYWPVPREDETTFAAIDFTFDSASYAGFAPVITVSRIDTDSNFSRWATEETSVTFDIRSNF